MRIVLLSRKPRPGQNFSIELIVQGLLRELSSDLNATLAISRFQSNGIVRRLYNIVEAAFRQGDVNHVTGDVHFLTYLLRKDRTLLTIHDCGRISGKLDLRKRLIREMWFRLPARRCAAITVVSETVKRELLTHVKLDETRVHVVPSFVPSLFKRVDKTFNGERPTILHVGTAENKNLARLCKALQGMRCKLHVVGPLSSKQRDDLAQFEIAYENFVSVTTERMVELYASCDVVSFVSTFEGFGMPIIEANLVGRPVVTSLVASMPEVAGDAACLVDPFDAAAIRRGIERVISDEGYRRRLVENGFKNAVRFHPALIARQYEILYRTLAKGSRGAILNQVASPRAFDTPRADL